jgi:hypothetical protein
MFVHKMFENNEGIFFINNLKFIGFIGVPMSRCYGSDTEKYEGVSKSSRTES